MDKEMAKIRTGERISGNLNRAVFGFVHDDEMEAANLKSTDLDLVVYTYENHAMTPVGYFSNKDLPDDTRRGLGEEQALRVHANIMSAAAFTAAGYPGGPWQIRSLNWRGNKALNDVFREHPELNLNSGWWRMDQAMLRNLVNYLLDPPWSRRPWPHDPHPEAGWDRGYKPVPILI